MIYSLPDYPSGKRYAQGSWRLARWGFEARLTFSQRPRSFLAALGNARLLKLSLGATLGPAGLRRGAKRNWLDQPRGFIEVSLLYVGLGLAYDDDLGPSVKLLWGDNVVKVFGRFMSLYPLKGLRGSRPNQGGV